jgi:hypothetical protein
MTPHPSRELLPLLSLALAACSAAPAPLPEARAAEPVATAPASPPDASVEPAAPATPPSSDAGPQRREVAPTVAAATLEAMAAAVTRVYVRGEQGCEAWELRGWPDDELSQLHLERVVRTRRVKGTQRRTRIQRVFDYQKGHLLDSDARGVYEEVWDERRREWKVRRDDRSMNGCFSLITPVVEPDGSILVGAERWHPSLASCEAAAPTAALPRTPGCS